MAAFTKQNTVDKNARKYSPAKNLAENHQINKNTAKNLQKRWNNAIKRHNASKKKQNNSDSIRDQCNQSKSGNSRDYNVVDRSNAEKHEIKNSKPGLPRQSFILEQYKTMSTILSVY